MLQRLKLDLSDKLGGLLAVICAIHCAALPILASVGTVFAHGILDLLFLISAIILTGFSTYSARKSNTLPRRILAMFILGIVLLVISLVFHLHLVSAMGGVVLAYAHYLNFKHKKTCSTHCKGH